VYPASTGELIVPKSKLAADPGAKLQVQVTDEAAVIVEVTVAAEPDAGTLPVPVQPVQVQIKLPSVTGLETLTVKSLPALTHCEA
jgi:hypothetical protein